MQSVQIQGLTLCYSEDFHPLTEAERAKLRFTEEGEGVSLSAPEKHILMTVAWKLGDALLPRLLGTRELSAWKTRKVEKPAALQDYKLGGLLRRSVGGQTADGLCYTYTASDIPMYGETLTLRDGRVWYYFHLYARQALKEESLPVWEDFLSSARWA